MLLCVFILGMAVFHLRLQKRKRAPGRCQGSRWLYGAVIPDQENVLYKNRPARAGANGSSPDLSQALGASMAVMRFPSMEGGFSIFARSASFSPMELLIPRPSPICLHSPPRESTLHRTFSLVL